MDSTRKLMDRYTDGERLNHWAIAILFFVAACSGLAFFHPSLYWLAYAVGGGAWARILHPFIGVLMLLSFVGLGVRVWRHNLMNADDRRWMKQWRDVVSNREERLPEVGKYNAGQKQLFWVLVVCMGLLLLTGIVIWRPYLAILFPIPLIRLSALVHAFSAFILVGGIIVHIYAAIWVRGTLRAMTHGSVTDGWAHKHHRKWYREMREQPPVSLTVETGSPQEDERDTARPDLAPAHAHKGAV